MGQMNKINVMNRAVKALAKENAMLKREEWIAQAEKCEEEGAILTCAAIIRETLGWTLDEDDDRKEIFKDDAKASMARGRYETARAIYAYALRIFPTSRAIWLAAADLERLHGTKDALWRLLEKAVEACPQSEVLWLQLAREKWHTGDVDGARIVLGKDQGLRIRGRRNTNAAYPATTRALIRRLTCAGGSRQVYQLANHHARSAHR